MVSVAMATFNGERFLKKQLDSILSQTYKNLEVIVTDDCSNDNTKQILLEYRKKYKIKVYFNEEKLGFVKNFEKAISLCSGDYIALCDQDDIWFENKIEILLNEIEDYSLIFSDACLVDEDENILNKSFIKFSGRRIPKKNEFQHLVFSNYITGCTLMFNKNLISNILPIPNLFPYHDWWIAVQATQKNGVKFCNKSLINYRQHNYNVTGAGKQLNFFMFLSNLFYRKKQIFEENLSKKNRILYLLKKNIFKNKNEKIFLQKSLNYISLLVGEKSGFSACFFLLKYGKNISQYKSSFLLFFKTMYFMLLYLSNKLKRNLISDS